MSQLTIEQRYKIEAYLKIGLSNKEIAEHLKVSPSTISREKRRNSDQRNMTYDPNLAERKCRKRHKEKHKYIALTDEIKEHIKYCLSEEYSPEQIVGYSKRENIKCVSHELIYQHIWKDKRAGGDLYLNLRTQGKRYAKRGSQYKKRGQISNRVDISERPQIVDEKTRAGDLEIDLIIGANHKRALLTINDRVTGILKMELLETKEAESVKVAVIKLLKNMERSIHTITSDNGKEFANHQEIAQALNIDYYFARPYHSWERGANENLNGLVRQYFKKGSSFEHITALDVENVVKKLNNRPRKRFNFKTPNEMHLEYLKNVA